MMKATPRQHAAKRQPSAQMRAAWCGLSVSLFPTNILGGNLGQETSIDSRYSRQ